MGTITSFGAGGAKREAQIAEGKSRDRNLSFLFFHVSSSNGLGAANIWMPNPNFPTSGSQPSLSLLCQVLRDSRPKPGRLQTPFPRAVPSKESQQHKGADKINFLKKKKR